jgi:adenylate cyclase
VGRGQLDSVVIPHPGGADEAAALADGWNDLVGALADRERLKSTLERHVGKKLVDEIKALPLGTGRHVRVTALFLEVTGPLGRTPEAMVSALHELVRACVEVVHAHDGHLEKLTGDSLLALWGVPQARPDDAVRAIQAGIALEERCRALAEARRARKLDAFKVAVGLATGDAVIATVGSEERADTVVVGEVITLARRIEEQARIHNFGVMVSEETYQGASTVFEGAATPPIVLAGISLPLTLYRVRPRKALPRTPTPAAHATTSPPVAGTPPGQRT